MNVILEKILNAFLQGELGFVVPRSKIRIKELENGDWTLSIREKSEGIVIFYELLNQSVEIRHKGKKFQKFSHKIKKLVENEVKEVRIINVN